MYREGGRIWLERGIAARPALLMSVSVVMVESTFSDGEEVWIL